MHKYLCFFWSFWHWQRKDIKKHQLSWTRKNCPESLFSHVIKFSIADPNARRKKHKTHNIYLWSKLFKKIVFVERVFSLPIFHVFMYLCLMFIKWTRILFSCDCNFNDTWNNINFSKVLFFRKKTHEKCLNSKDHKCRYINANWDWNNTGIKFHVMFKLKFLQFNSKKIENWKKNFLAWEKKEKLFLFYWKTILVEKWSYFFLKNTVDAMQ